MKGKKKQNRFFEELKRFHAASEKGDLSFVINFEGFSNEEMELARTLNDIARNYEAALEYDLMKYKLTSDALGIGLWDMDFVSDDPGDRNNRLIWSREARELMGFSDEKEFPNRLSSLTDRIHPGDRKESIKAFVAHIADRTGKTPFDVEYRLMMKSGEYRHFRSFGTTLRNSEGAPLRVAGAIEDINDRKIMQESLRKAQEERVALANLVNILNGLSAMICVTDPETDELLFINNSMKKAFGIDYECTGQKCHKVLRNFDERCDFCPCNKLSLDSDEVLTWEYSGRTEAETYRHISRYIKWPGGRIAHIQNAIDITDIKEAERSIAEKNEFNQTLFENSPIGLTLYDENYNFIDCNENILRMFGGITREFYAEFFGSPEHSPEYQPDGTKSYDKAVEIIKRVVANGENLKINWVHNMPDGEPFPVEITLTRIKHGDRYAGLAYVYDMREQNRLKREVEEALHKAEDANKAKSDFLAKMSHEIRTPMNAILGLAEIQMRSDTLPPDTEEALGQIYDSGNMLMGIINDILDLSKIEADKLEIIPVVYEIASLVNDTAQLNRLRSSSELIEFDIRLDKNTPHSMVGDELRIKQILNNVLSNAFKYTEKGRVEFSIFTEEITPETKSTLSSKAPEGSDVMLIFCVSDTGQGMTEEQLEILFTDYTRFNLETNRTTTGTGLGLSITRHLADLMGGNVLVESEVGVGTVFTIRLPQKRHGTKVCGEELSAMLRNARFRSSSFAKKTQFVREYMPYGNVLVVDDVESNIYVAKGMLLPYGLEIDFASSGFEAIEKIRNGKEYDIVFMDHMMPVMDGVEATEKIRGMGYKGTIVALTANALIGQSDLFLQSGFDAFVSKPIDSRELNQILNEFIRNKKPREVVAAARKEQAGQQGKGAGRGKGKKAEPATPESLAQMAEMRKLVVRDATKAVDTLERVLPVICEGALNSSGMDDVIKSYTVTVHGMKSTLANIGKTEVSDASLRLEMAGKERDLGIIKKETPGYIASLRSLIAELSSAEDLKGGEAAGAPAAGKADMVFLREKLLEIKAACETYNVTAAREALGSLNERAWPKDVGDALDELGVHLLHSAFKKAAQTAEEIAGR